MLSWLTFGFGEVGARGADVLVPVKSVKATVTRETRRVRVVATRETIVVRCVVERIQDGD